MRYTVRPISDHTTFARRYQESNFLVSWPTAEDLLDKELRELGARDVILEVDVPPTGFRLDGSLRADAKSNSPAVRLVFESKYGLLTYATDRFVRGRARQSRGGEMVTKMPADWMHNVYAIAKSLEALRLVDRYGVTKRGEQYTGWKALPAGGIALGGGMSTDQARDVLVTLADVQHLPAVNLRAVLRKARHRAHPDRNDGDRALWDEVEQAAAVLGLLS